MALNEYNYHRDKVKGQKSENTYNGYEGEPDIPELDFIVKWKYQNPEGKDAQIAEKILKSQGNKIAEILDEKNPVKLEGYGENLPYVITDEIYEEKIKAEIERKQRDNEAEIERKQRDEQHKTDLKANEDKIKAEKERIDKLMTYGGQEYNEYIRDKWTKITSLNKGSRSYYSDLTRQLTNILEDFKKRKNISPQGYLVLHGKTKPCGSADFIIDKKQWFDVKTYIRENGSDDGCYDTKIDTDKPRCILKQYKDDIESLEKEFGCLGMISQTRNKISNLSDRIYERFAKKTEGETMITTGGKKTKKSKRGTKRSKNFKKSKKNGGKKKK